MEHGFLIFYLTNSLSLEYFISVSKIKKKFGIKNSRKIYPLPCRLGPKISYSDRRRGGSSVICLITLTTKTASYPWLYRSRLGHPLSIQTTHGPQKSLCQAQLSSEVPVIWGCQIHRKKHINNKKRGTSS